MTKPTQTNNSTLKTEIKQHSTQEPSTPYKSVKFESANFYDNHIIRKMPLPTWDEKDYPK